MNQKEAIKKYLDTGKMLTCNDALRELGISNFKGRIHELRQEGYEIESKWVSRTSKVTGEEVRVKLYYSLDAMNKYIDAELDYFDKNQSELSHAPNF